MGASNKQQRKTENRKGGQHSAACCCVRAAAAAAACVRAAAACVLLLSRRRCSETQRLRCSQSLGGSARTSARPARPGANTQRACVVVNSPTRDRQAGGRAGRQAGRQAGRRAGRRAGRQADAAVAAASAVVAALRRGRKSAFSTASQAARYHQRGEVPTRAKAHPCEQRRARSLT